MPVMPTSAWLIGVLAATLVSGCASSGKKSAADDLDIEMSDKPSEKPLTYADVVPTKDDAGSLPKSAVTNWQSFFKAPPSQQERNVLEQKLAGWKDSEGADDLIKRARTEVAVGRLAAAETSLRKSLRLNGDNQDAQLELAALYLRKKDVAKAFELLSQVKDGISTRDVTAQSFVFRYRYTLALAYIARGDRDKGHKVLSDLIGVDKGFAPAYASLAASYLELGKDSVAEFVIRRGLDRVKEHAGLLNLMGVISRRAKQMEAARGWFDKALVVDPRFAPSLVNRAMLSAAAMEYGTAEEDLLTALAAEPQNGDALVSLGIVQRRQGNFTGAKASFTKAVDADPENAYARFNLGVLLVEDLKRPNDAMRLFSEVTQTSNASPELKATARSMLQDLQPGGTPY